MSFPSEEMASKAVDDDLVSRKSRIASDFDRVAWGYDRLNALHPGYAKHLRWSAERLGLGPDDRILDLCCGTGLSTAALRTVYPAADLTGIDASVGMLECAREKPGLEDVMWLQGDAMDPDAAGAVGPYDGILMAYGIRNMPDPDLCLRRLSGLLAEGGVLCLHEYSVAGSARARLIWKGVTTGIVIPLGFLLTHTTSIFRYLRRSVLEFDSVDEMEGRLRKVGFVDVRTEPMDGWQRGVVHSFLARKPA
jgi:ubiquinone/menaquinone biosynthesis C-methylase UbiE